MTATPIPRTLTLAQYGEMDVSRLDEMPPGRQPIETRVLSSERLAEVVDALGRHIAAAGQAYGSARWWRRAKPPTRRRRRSGRRC
jgi:ATP-dependent DNA helicase RecG